MNSQRAHCGQLNAQFISPLWNRALIEYPVNQYLHFWLIGPALFLSRAPERIDLTGEKCSSDLQTLFVLFALELRTILGQKLDLFIKRWSHQNFSVRHRWMFKLITQRGSQIYQESVKSTATNGGMWGRAALTKHKPLLQVFQVLQDVFILHGFQYVESS